MADFCIFYFSLENCVSKLITDVLSEKHGAGWWEERVYLVKDKKVIKQRANSNYFIDLGTQWLERDYASQKIAQPSKKRRGRAWSD